MQRRYCLGDSSWQAHLPRGERYHGHGAGEGRACQLIHELRQLGVRPAAEDDLLVGAAYFSVWAQTTFLEMVASFAWSPSGTQVLTSKMSRCGGDEHAPEFAWEPRGQLPGGPHLHRRPRCRCYPQRWALQLSCTHTELHRAGNDRLRHYQVLILISI